MNKHKGKYLLLFIVCFLALASSNAWAHIIPDAKGYVNDFAGVLTDSEMKELEALSEEVRSANGSELVVVVVNTTTDTGEDFEKVRVDYFNEQGIGQKDVNNGVLVLLAVKQKKIGITTGRGMEKALPDALCKEIIDTKGVPHFKKGSEKWGEGLLEMVKEMVPYIKAADFTGTQKEEQPPPPKPKQGGCAPALGVLILLVLLRR